MVSPDVPTLCSFCPSRKPHPMETHATLCGRRCSASGTPGCTDPGSACYNAAATFDDGSCLVAGCVPFRGCTNSASFNYDPNANVDSGACVASISGCGDQLASNYDSTVTSAGTSRTSFRQPRRSMRRSPFLPTLLSRDSLSLAQRASTCVLLAGDVV
jgi:hypothetical protein